MAVSLAKCAYASLLVLSALVCSEAYVLEGRSLQDDSYEMQVAHAIEGRIARLQGRSIEHQYRKRDVSVSTALPTNWTYTGCYEDSVDSRTLSGPYYGDASSMTVESCISFCDGKGYILAGTEYGQECYCDIALPSTATNVSISDCSMACSGNTTEGCGAGNRLSVYSKKVTTAPTAPTHDLRVGNWSYLGCYNDSVGARTLANGVQTTGGGTVMTVALCAAACEDAGYKYAGAEYGGECYCGDSLSNYGGPASDGWKGCNMQCNGNSSEYCGGSNRLDMYGFNVKNASTATTSSATVSSSLISASTSSSLSGVVTSSAANSSTVSNKVNVATSATATPTGWVSLGCYTDAGGSRALENQQWDLGDITVEKCQAGCLAAGYSLAGVEYADECYCDNSIQNGNTPATDGCNMACTGNSSEICGGSNRLNIYQYSSGSSSSSASTSATTKASSAVSTSATASSTSAVALPTGWKYQGCYIDNANGRILANQQPDSADLTIESCVETCEGLGYSVAGMQYSTQCFCDNFIRNGGTNTSESDCSMACGGDSSEICGGPNRDTIYSNGTLKVYQPPTAQNSSLPGNWTYQGCITDIDGARTFPYKNVLTDNNTAESCLNLCAAYGYGAAGTEYSDECYCGDVQNMIDAGATFAAESDCNMACSGNASTICGGPSRMSYYNWTGTPLNSWDFKTGNAAGSYEFLIGGVTIPLVTSPVVNGKVTFLEKFGTGPGNETGAYELDLATLDNFTAAWRPMHVKSDIFCAASLTMPDKVGRQINVGGWANDATYAIRFYSPDGKPGTWGSNDWEENSSELSLQAGRWYPTAMTMTNGSILVIGGEEGSNGAPVPNLEILPKPAGGYLKYLDWLERTDPYNLYPYMAVLPSGGIFTQYYNEARLLDETTFDTIRTYPNAPGAVNNLESGRTYPMEGTAMLMPQHAPYTDPLEVTICGGSTIGPEIALDNCVSIKPEQTNANWTLERMPSKRVISCMTALPDGTYLILNGAHQGFAGFGLASDPNHNAVLYDPSKPYGQRMSVLANTTIDRLYHSEAILLQDGRVLVSGSDPEDDTHVQEYRVEVFNPPYLLSGNTRPKFTITDRDWAYGHTASFTVTTGSGSTANVKVSLMGAEASTHGNTMGQRTLFPAFSCSGTTCTVTAPPNAHVAPPAYFQMFVLDNGVPSTSTWVRIGGDPGNLGDWPSGLSDFTAPGTGAAVFPY